MKNIWIVSIITLFVSGCLFKTADERVEQPTIMSLNNIDKIVMSRYGKHIVISDKQRVQTIINEMNDIITHEKNWLKIDGKESSNVVDITLHSKDITHQWALYPHRLVYKSADYRQLGANGWSQSFSAKNHPHLVQLYCNIQQNTDYTCY